MSDGMSDYWRAKRAYEREEKIKRDFYFMVTSLLYNRPSPHRMMKTTNKMLEQMFDTMKIK